MALSRPPHSQSTHGPEARSQAFPIQAFPIQAFPIQAFPIQAFPIQSGSDFFQVVPPFIKLDHPRPALRLGLLGGGCRERLEPRLEGGVETPSRLAVRFIDRPLTSSSTTAAFRASGLPRAGVWVKVRPHPLHKERCCPRIRPFFTGASLPQRLHRSPMTTLLHDPLGQQDRPSMQS